MSLNEESSYQKLLEFLNQVHHEIQSKYQDDELDHLAILINGMQLDQNGNSLDPSMRKYWLNVFKKNHEDLKAASKEFLRIYYQDFNFYQLKEVLEILDK